MYEVVITFTDREDEPMLEFTTREYAAQVARICAESAYLAPTAAKVQVLYKGIVVESFECWST